MDGLEEQTPEASRLHVKNDRAGGKLNMIKIVTGIPSETFKRNYDAIDWSKKSNEKT